MSIVHYVEMDSGWLIKESNIFYPYGQISIIQRNSVSRFIENDSFPKDRKIYEAFDLWLDIFECTLLGDNAGTNTYLETIFNAVKYIPTIPMLIDGKWHNSIIVNTDYDGDVNNITKDGSVAPLAICFLDLITCMKLNLRAKICPNCGDFYFSSKKNKKYCDRCSNNYKRIADSKRNNTARGLHKKVGTYLTNSEKFSVEEISAFRNESDYYWDKLQGKSILNDKYPVKILSETDYISWLLNKHTEYKEIAKKRTKTHWV